MSQSLSINLEDRFSDHKHSSRATFDWVNKVSWRKAEREPFPLRLLLPVVLKWHRMQESEEKAERRLGAHYWYCCEETKLNASPTWVTIKSGTNTWKLLFHCELMAFNWQTQMGKRCDSPEMRCTCCMFILSVLDTSHSNAKVNLFIFLFVDANKIEIKAKDSDMFVMCVSMSCPHFRLLFSDFWTFLSAAPKSFVCNHRLR